MSKLRKGDTVTFTAIVTDVADYDGGEQQILARILPKGESIGWCLQKENAFKPLERKIVVGDWVKWSKNTSSTRYEILLVADGQATVRGVNSITLHVAQISDLTRL